MGSFLRITPGTGGVQGENTTPFMRSYSDRPTGTPHTDAMTSWYVSEGGEMGMCFVGVNKCT